MNQHHESIRAQYSSPAGRSLYSHVMGDGGDHIHYGIYKDAHTTMQEALNASCHRLFEMSLNKMDINALTEILDLGAGAGGPAKCLLSWSKARLTCVDIGAPTLEVLEQWAHSAEMSSRLRIHHGSFNMLPQHWSSSFDLVWSQDALCHASNRLEVFSEARRVLRSGGAMVFSDILLAQDAPTELAAAFTSVNAVQQLGTPQDYLHDLKEAGFTKVCCEDWTSHLPMNFLRMQQQIETKTPTMLEEGVSQEMIDRFSDALAQRLRWPSGSVLNWCAYHCRTN